LDPANLALALHSTNNRFEGHFANREIKSHQKKREEPKFTRLAQKSLKEFAGGCGSLLRALSQMWLPKSTSPYNITPTSVEKLAFMIRQPFHVLSCSHPSSLIPV